MHAAEAPPLVTSQETASQEAPTAGNARGECVAGAAAAPGGDTAVATVATATLHGVAGAAAERPLAGDEAAAAEAAVAAAAELQEQQTQLPMPQQRSTLNAEQVQAMKAFEIKLRMDNEKYKSFIIYDYTDVNKPTNYLFPRKSLKQIVPRKKYDSLIVYSSIDVQKVRNALFNYIIYIYIYVFIILCR